MKGAPPGTEGLHPQTLQLTMKHWTKWLPKSMQFISRESREESSHCEIPKDSSFYTMIIIGLQVGILHEDSHHHSTCIGLEGSKKSSPHSHATKRKLCWIAYSSFQWLRNPRVFPTNLCQDWWERTWTGLYLTKASQSYEHSNVTKNEDVFVVEYECYV